MDIFFFNNINFSYDANHQVLHDVSFSLSENDWAILAGPSGIGKSTILKIAAQLITQDSGSLSISEFGEPDESNILQWRRLVSYASQMPTLFGETVKDNFAFIFDINKKTYDETKVNSLLKNFGLDNPILESKISELSGGQRQRIGLARHLVFPPKVLLLDEISTGLDASTKKKVISTIKKTQKDNHFAVLEISHETDRKSDATKIISLHKGGKVTIKNAK